MESFKPVPGCRPHYRVGDEGSMLSSHKRCRGPVHSVEDGTTWRYMTPQMRGKGYLRVELVTEKGKAKEFSVHRLMLMAFVGPCPDGQEGCHHDGNKLNNRLGNLRWDTRKANHADALRHGTHPGNRKGKNRGRKQHLNKLSESAVRDIRKGIAKGSTRAALAEKHGVSTGAIAGIVSGRSWSWLS